jgi:micrococcal nuclease
VKKMIKNTLATRARLLFAAAMTAAIFGALALFSAGAPAKDANPSPPHALAPQAVIQAEVTGVADGDTLSVLLDGTRHNIRLARIDAPEKRQPFGRRSEQSLRQLVWKRTVTLEWHRLDRYGRPIADVTLDGLDVNAEQVKRGMAWVYLQYSQDANLIALEREARAGKLGLWEQPDPVAPWQWRQVNRVTRPEAAVIGSE